MVISGLSPWDFLVLALPAGGGAGLVTVFSSAAALGGESHEQEFWVALCDSDLTRSCVLVTRVSAVLSVLLMAVVVLGMVSLSRLTTLLQGGGRQASIRRGTHLASAELDPGG